MLRMQIVMALYIVGFALVRKYSPDDNFVDKSVYRVNKSHVQKFGSHYAQAETIDLHPVRFVDCRIMQSLYSSFTT